MRDLARNNLYFKGFPCEGTMTIEDLTTEISTFFEKFGEVKTLKLPTRKTVVEGIEHQVLIGFGFVSF